MVDRAYEKEQEAKETIKSLKKKITHLSKLVEEGSGSSLGQDK